MALAICIGLYSCSSDDSNSELGTKFDNKVLVGEWCCINGDEITYFTLADQLSLKEKNTFEIGELTTDLIDHNVSVGVWGLVDENLRIRYISSLSGDDRTYDYKVKNVTDYGFTATQTNIGMTYNFCRVVCNKSTIVGEEFKFVIPDDYKNFTPASYSSSDSRIASVDNEGNIKVKKCGTAFIMATSDAGTLMTKVETPEPQIETVPKHYMTDVFMTVNDFMEKYSDYFFLDPDYSDGTLMFIPDNSLFSLCLAYFDTETEEIYTMFYKLNNPNDRAQIDNYLAQTMVAIVNNAGNTVYTETGSLEDYTLGTLWFTSDTTIYLRYINNKWYSRQ